MTINGSEHKVGLVNGQEGEIIYLDPTATSASDLRKQTILDYNTYVCETSADIDKSKAFSFSLNDVFKIWSVGGHSKNGKWYGYDSNYPSTGSFASYIDYNAHNNKQPSSYVEATYTAPHAGWRSSTIPGYNFWIYNEAISSIVQI